MNITPVKLLRGLALLGLTIAWAWLAHYGSTGDSTPDFSAALATAPLVAMAVMFLWRVANPLWLAAGGLGVLALLAWSWPHLRQNVALLYFVQHVGTNLALGMLFGRTLYGQRQALITQFASLAQDGVLSEAKRRYTRQATIAWTLFFFLTAILSSLLFWLATPATWSVFANLLTGPLVVLMFVAEHLCRYVILPPGDRAGIADSIRGYRAAMQRPASVRLAKHP